MKMKGAVVIGARGDTEGRGLEGGGEISMSKIDKNMAIRKSRGREGESCCFSGLESALKGRYFSRSIFAGAIIGVAKLVIATRADSDIGVLGLILALTAIVLVV
jgi:hypothetical protein